MPHVGLETRPSAPHLILSGEIDLLVAPSLKESGTAMVRSVAPARVEIDLGDVTFIDSSGLGALISIRNAARQAGTDLVLVRVSRAVSRLFELTGVGDSFTIE
jgi:anti-anti-sigma factor